MEKGRKGEREKGRKGERETEDGRPVTGRRGDVEKGRRMKTGDW